MSVYFKSILLNWTIIYIAFEKGSFFRREILLFVFAPIKSECVTIQN